MIAAAVAAIALTVSPTRVELVGAGTQVVRVTNAGSATAIIDVTRAGFALDLGGRPRIIKNNASWLSFSPHQLRVRAGGSARLTVRSHPPRGLAPGDHPGLLLLTQHPVARGGLAVRTRVGVVVSLRVPGRVVHRLVVTGVHVAGGRVLVSLSNRGNVTEVLGSMEVSVTLRRGSRLLGRTHPTTRELLPGAHGLVALRYSGRVRGLATAQVDILASGDRRSLSQTFRVSL